MKKILILGGHGFLGRNLAKKLPNALIASRRDGVDLCNLETTKSYLKSQMPEIIYNCVAHVGSVHYVSKFAADVLRDNIQMNLNLYEAVKEVCPSAEIINPISNCSYPGEANIHFEPDWLNGAVHPSVCAYANAKRTVYFLSECYKSQYGITSKNFILPNLFGPGDYTDPNKVHAFNGMVIRMIQAMRGGKKQFEVWGSGNPIREWGYIDDVVNVLVLGKDLSVDLIYPVNVGMNKGLKIKEVAESIAKSLEYEVTITYNTNYQDGAPIKVLDDKKFRTLFPDYQFCNYELAIQETVKYYKEIL